MSQFKLIGYLGIVWSLLSVSSLQAKSQKEWVLQELKDLRTSVERLESEVAILRAQSRLVIRRTTIGYLNAAYLKGTLSILLPRESTFTTRTDTGLGAHFGIGKYFGRTHVLELTMDWDLYPALSLRYRIDIHSNDPQITIAPVFGVKQKILDVNPFDDFFDDPSAVNGTFAIVGGFIGIPLGKSLLATELDILISGQVIITLSAGMHFFI